VPLTGEWSATGPQNFAEPVYVWRYSLYAVVKDGREIPWAAG
jgi:hypothetical protein